MASLQPIRGTHDLLKDDRRLHDQVEETAKAIAGLYGFAEVTTPIIEFTDVFARTLGDTSDVVTKEMYSFEDKGGDRITLRPEGTAGIARAFMSNGLAQLAPFKAFYRGPMFRRERPQKGRQRQFHQIGIELIGQPQAQADIEVVACAAQILEGLGLGTLGDAVQLELNSLGDTDSRAAYRETLIAYLEKYTSDLSADSRERLHKNPLRVLDSKDEKDREIVADAPKLSESLNEASTAFFAEVREGLDRLNIPYLLNEKLVRGLDYYCHTTFEFTTTRLGAQGTVLAGGRYDGLIKMMGGPQTPGVGWAAGVERLALLVGEAPAAEGPVAVIPVGGDQAALALEITQRLRKAGIATDLGYSGNMKKRLTRANNAGARAAIILGSDEVARGGATFRDMVSGEQKEVPLADLEEILKAGL
ncbi:MAG: histidine--tRNA ligase [Magnetovibrionaceae bacterium]